MNIKVYKQFTDEPTAQSYYIYDSICNEEWSELMQNLREPGGSYMKCGIWSSLFIAFLGFSHELFKHEGGLSSAFYF